MAQRSRMRVDFLIIGDRASPLPALPPDGNPDDDHKARQKQSIDPRKARRLSNGQRNVAAGFSFRPNRYLIFVLGEPVDRIEEKITIATRTTQHLVGREVRV